MYLTDMHCQRLGCQPSDATDECGNVSMLLLLVPQCFFELSKPATHHLTRESRAGTNRGHHHAMRAWWLV